VGCAIIMIGGGTVVGVFLNRRATVKKPGNAQPDHAQEAVKVATVFSLGEMVVNLADTDSLRYAKLSVALGIEEKLAEEKLKEHEAELRDGVIDVLTSHRFAELHGKGGVQRLKKELARTLSSRFHAGRISKVYLESFAMQ
jgi:flagellar FliL protein